MPNNPRINFKGRNDGAEDRYTSLPSVKYIGLGSVVCIEL